MKAGKINFVQSAIAAMLGLMLGVGGLTAMNRTRPAAIIIEPAPPTAEPGPTATPQPISVYVNGSVNAPGVYELPADSRVQAAIDAAGGLSADAFVDGVNLAQLLFDGAQVYVVSAEQNAGAQAALLANTVSSNSGVSGGAANSESGVVNLNTATSEQLQTIPGVGPSTAQKILDYREDNGTFQMIEDIMNVSGIGEGKFEAMRDFIAVDG